MIKAIFNFQFSIFNSKESREGFTLVELLVSIIVLIAIGAVIINMITSSLRGSNKTNNIEIVRQNGNYALNQISKNIQYAQVFNGFSNDGINYVASCPFDDHIPPPPLSPITTAYPYIKVTPLDSNPIEYHCTSSDFTSNNQVDPVGSVVDTGIVDMTACSITCTQTNVTDTPVIGIRFTLRYKGSDNLVENSNPDVKFETSIVMRNYRRM